MFGINQTEIFIVLVIVLIIFGPKNLPRLAKSMGSAIRDFKSSLGGVDREINETMDNVKRMPDDPLDTEATVASTGTSASSEPKSE